MSLLSAQQQRYSTKVFDPQQGADPQKIQQLLDIIHLSPSSINSQPWHVFVIRDSELKQKLAAAAWDYNQPKFTEASHLFVFCAKTEFGAAEVREIEQHTADVRGVALNEQRLAFLTEYVESMPRSEKKHWLKQQVYLMFGQFLLAAAELQLDACPIEGFYPEQMDDLLELREQGLTSVVTAVVGQRSSDDFNTLDKACKVRFPQSVVFSLID